MHLFHPDDMPKCTFSVWDDPNHNTVLGYATTGRCELYFYAFNSHKHQ